ncbi:MAG: FmdE family protein [Chloroflexota bacterium]
MRDIKEILQESSARHKHLCPRQVLGVRMGLYASQLLSLRLPCLDKRLLVIAETDGCFVDGVIAATNCTVGHRTLRVEDYGKVAATFVDTRTKGAIRIAPRQDVRERACALSYTEPRHYFAQLHAYQAMSNEEMLTVQDVVLSVPIEKIISKPGLRVNCDVCGEEIMNEREINQKGLTLCRICAYGGYYQAAHYTVLHLLKEVTS